MLGSAALHDAGCRKAARALRDARTDVETRMGAQTDLMLASAERTGRETQEKTKDEPGASRIRDDIPSSSRITLLTGSGGSRRTDGSFIVASCKRITDTIRRISRRAGLIEKIVHPDDRATSLHTGTKSTRTLEAERRVPRRPTRRHHRWWPTCASPSLPIRTFLDTVEATAMITRAKKRRMPCASRRNARRYRRSFSAPRRGEKTGRPRASRRGEPDPDRDQIRSRERARPDDQEQRPSRYLIGKIISMVQHAIEETSGSRWTCDRPSWTILGLAALSWFSREFENVYKRIRIERTIEAAEEEVPICEIVIFRIVQEALNNVAKHSGADLVRLGSINRGRGIRADDPDNGQGFDLEKAVGGFG